MRCSSSATRGMSWRKAVRTAWAAVTTAGRACPECGTEMDSTYVHDPAFQNHWRGSPADECPDCGLALRQEG